MTQDGNARYFPSDLVTIVSDSIVQLKALLSSTAPSEANDFLHVAKVPKSLPIEPLPTKTDSSLVPSKATSILQAAFLGSSASIK